MQAVPIGVKRDRFAGSRNDLHLISAPIAVWMIVRNATAHRAAGARRRQDEAARPGQRSGLRPVGKGMALSHLSGPECLR